MASCAARSAGEAFCDRRIEGKQEGVGFLELETWLLDGHDGLHEPCGFTQIPAQTF